MPLYIAQSGDLDRCYRCLTHWLTDWQTLKDSATQLPIKYKSGALVTQWKNWKEKSYETQVTRGEGYFVETLLQRQNERTGFIGSSKSPNDGAIRSEICLITWSSCLTSDWFDLDWISGLWLDLDHFDCAGNQISFHWQCQYSEKKTRIRLARA